MARITITLTFLFFSLAAGCAQEGPPSPSNNSEQPEPPKPRSKPVPEERTPQASAPVPQRSKVPLPSKRKLQWLHAEISRHELRSQELWDYARQFDDYTHIGTAYNEINIPQHSCFVLGHLLRRGVHVTHLEVRYDTDMTDTSTEGTHAMRVAGHSMTNFVHVAREMLEKSPEQRAEEWNLDCVGHFDIPSSAYIETGKQNAFYEVKNDGKVLQVLGDIEPGFEAKVRRALDQNPKVETVALGSGGGLVLEAVRTGILIRQRGLTTTLWNNCYSACPFVFFGGKERHIWSPYPKLGFHQVYTGEGIPEPIDSPIYTALSAYVREMGVDSQYVVQNMWRALPEEMNYVEANGDEDLCARGLATWVQRRCNTPGEETRNDMDGL